MWEAFRDPCPGRAGKRCPLSAWKANEGWNLLLGSLSLGRVQEQSSWLLGLYIKEDGAEQAQEVWICGLRRCWRGMSVGQERV